MVYNIILNRAVYMFMLKTCHVVLINFLLLFILKMLILLLAICKILKTCNNFDKTSNFCMTLMFFFNYSLYFNNNYFSSKFDTIIDYFFKNKNEVFFIL